MDHHAVVADHPKKRRRRRVTRPPISAWIRFSEDLKGEVGRISDDIYTALFSYASPPTTPALETPDIRYIAATPWASCSPDPVLDDTWRILPVVGVDNSEAARLPPSTVLLSAKSPNLRDFAEVLRASVVAGNPTGKLGFKIRALDVEPLNLHAVLVEVDGNALKKHYEVQKKFGGGFDAFPINGFPGKGKGKEKQQARDRTDSATTSPAESQGKTLVKAIKQALQLQLVIRQDDLLSLPLPAHPITHVSFPPARIAFVEPVSQGILVPSTQITVKQIFHKVHVGQSVSASAVPHSLRRSMAEQEDSPSNGQLSYAVENNHSARDQCALSGEDSSGSASSTLDSGSLSEDSEEDVISMTVPHIPVDYISSKSSLTTGILNGVHSRISGSSSPGSICSNITTTTVRQHSVSGIGVFQTKALSSKVAESLLHPKPHSDEDEEARVFLDVKMLLKLGCFSGDWVRIDTSAASSISQHSPWDDAFATDHTYVGTFRAAKVYGLPGLSLRRRYRYSRDRGIDKPESSSGCPAQNRSTPCAWFSPILLVNMGSPSSVRLSPLSKTSSEPALGSAATKNQITSSSSPPIAKEVALIKISTPLSTEMALQASLFTALTHHFDAKHRIIRQGDLVPLAIDTLVGRILAQSSAASAAGKGTEERLLMDLSKQNHQPKSRGIVWFRVEQVVGFKPDEEQDFSDADVWGCWACIEPITTCKLQGATETSKIPSTVGSGWQSYLGVTLPPKYETDPHTWETSSRGLGGVHITSVGRRLRELIDAGMSLVAAQHGISPMFLLLHSTQRRIGKATLVLRACADLGVHLFTIDAHNLLAESGTGGADVKTELTFRAQVERALSCKPETTIILLRHVEAFMGDRMTQVIKEVVTDFRVLIATTTELEAVSEDLRSLFTHELEFLAPDESEREGTLRTIIEERSVRLSHDVDLSAIAIKTAALVAGDLADVVERAVIAREHRLEGLTAQSSNPIQSFAPVLVRDILISGGENARCVTKADFEVAVDAARKNFADSIGAPKIPNVSWEDVGGLEHVKDAVMETIQLPLERPELFAKGMKKRSGILFYGPPGTGKTLLAKAIATEFSLNFFSVKGPELLNMYIGESEANVRRVFQRARDARPCVVFFDELDSVAPKRGNQGDSGGVMDRIVSQLLAELDGMSSGEEGGGGVFVIGATNRPDLLDQALLRPGRFDKMLYLGVSNTHEKQRRILEALTRRFNLRPDVSLRRVAESLPFTYTGADLYAICSDAMLKAITRQCTAVDSRIKALKDGTVTPAYFFDHLATPDDIQVTVTEQDFIAAQRELVGSVRYDN